MTVIKNLFLVLFSISILFAQAQDREKKNWPKIEFETLVYDFGEIPYNSPGNYDFVFRNKGKGPLIIKSVKST